MNKQKLKSIIEGSTNISDAILLNLDSYIEVLKLEKTKCNHDKNKYCDRTIERKEKQLLMFYCYTYKVIDQESDNVNLSQALFDYVYNGYFLSSEDNLSTKAYRVENYNTIRK